jgi:hypothetical protein
MRPHLPTLSLLLLAACGGGTDRTSGRDTLTQRQKDSLTAQSALPGAQGVQGALNAQDTGAARQRVVDSIANAP